MTIKCHRAAFKFLQWPIAHGTPHNPGERFDPFGLGTRKCRLAFFCFRADFPLRSLDHF